MSPLLMKVSLLWTVAVMMMSHSAIASDDNGPLEVVVQQLASRVEQLEARMTGCEDELQDLRRLEPSVVFSVQLSDTSNISTGSIIVFDTVLLNTGGGYSQRHGEFTAPVSGLYFLALRGWTRHDHAGWLQLRLNDRTISEVAVGDGDYESSASQSLVVHLDQGDIIDVGVNNAVTGGAAVELMGSYRTSLSGFLLQAD